LTTFFARVRLLGENLVAYRDTLGRVGLLQENCPHLRRIYTDKRTKIKIALSF